MSRGLLVYGDGRTEWRDDLGGKTLILDEDPYGDTPRRRIFEVDCAVDGTEAPNENPSVTLVYLERRPDR